MKREAKLAKQREYRDTQRGRMINLAGDARKSARRRGHECTITNHDLQRIWDQQSGLCAYTGWPMDSITHSPTLVSTERINNDIGYVEGNVVLVCWCVNRARGAMTQLNFFDMCRAVADSLKLSGTGCA